MTDTPSAAKGLIARLREMAKWDTRSVAGMQLCNEAASYIASQAKAIEDLGRKNMILKARLAADHRFHNAPCPCCDYNGPGYYQPETHPCAAMYHAAVAKRTGVVTTKEIDDAALASAKAAVEGGA